MKRVVVRPAAAADIEDAYQWYESQQPGLDEYDGGPKRTNCLILPSKATTFKPICNHGAHERTTRQSCDELPVHFADSVCGAR